MKVLKRARRVLSNPEVLEMVRKLGKTKSTAIETMRYMVSEYAAQKSTLSAEEAQKLKGMGLTEFEVAQLTNICPKSLLDIHICIEEMEERLEEADTQRILEMFRR